VGTRSGFLPWGFDSPGFVPALVQDSVPLPLFYFDRKLPGIISLIAFFPRRSYSQSEFYLLQADRLSTPKVPSAPHHGPCAGQSNLVNPLHTLLHTLLRSVAF
jgi:hypothetical protein